MDMGFQYSKSKILVARFLELFFLPFKWLIPSPSQEGADRILIIEPFMLGDAALLAVMLDPLKDKFPTAKIEMLVSPVAIPLFKDDPRVSAVIGVRLPWVDKQWNRQRIFDLIELIKQLRGKRFTIGIDARGEVRNQILLLLAGCGTRVGFTNYLCSNMTISGRLLTHSLGNVPLKHRTEINIELCRRLGCDSDMKLPALMRSSSIEIDKNRYIVLHPGSSWKYRRWAKEKWKQLIGTLEERFELNITIIGTPQEKVLLEELADSGKACTIQMSGIDALMATLCNAEAFIGLDSGPMNMASMLNIPCIALFGPGVLEMYRSTSERSVSLHHQAAYPCSPCSQRECIHPDSTCTNAIAVEEVALALQAIIKRDDK